MAASSSRPGLSRRPAREPVVPAPAPAPVEQPREVDPEESRRRQLEALWEEQDRYYFEQHRSATSPPRIKRELSFTQPSSHQRRSTGTNTTWSGSGSGGDGHDWTSETASRFATRSSLPTPATPPIVQPSGLSRRLSLQQPWESDERTQRAVQAQMEAEKKRLEAERRRRMERTWQIESILKQSRERVPSKEPASLYSATSVPPPARRPEFYASEPLPDAPIADEEPLPPMTPAPSEPAGPGMVGADLLVPATPPTFMRDLSPARSDEGSIGQPQWRPPGVLINRGQLEHLEDLHQTVAALNRARLISLDGFRAELSAWGSCPPAFDEYLQTPSNNVSLDRQLEMIDLGMQDLQSLFASGIRLERLQRQITEARVLHQRHQLYASQLENELNDLQTQLGLGIISEYHPSHVILRQQVHDKETKMTDLFEQMERQALILDALRDTYEENLALVNSVPPNEPHILREDTFEQLEYLFNKIRADLDDALKNVFEDRKRFSAFRRRR